MKRYIDRDPSQQRRAARREPGRGEIPMKLNAQLEDAFPEPRGGVDQISVNTQNDVMAQRDGKQARFYGTIRPLCFYL